MQYMELELGSRIVIRFSAYTFNISDMLHFPVSNSSKPMSINMLHTRNISLRVTQISVYQIPLVVRWPDKGTLKILRKSFDSIFW